MTPREALDRIAALCDDRDKESSGGGQWSENGALRTTEVRAILAEVSPEPGGRRLTIWQAGGDGPWDEPPPEGEDTLSFEESTEPWGGVLDRVQARAVLDDEVPVVRQDDLTSERLLDRLAACVRPVAIGRDALWAVYDRYSMPNDVQEDRGLGFDSFVQEVEACVWPVAGVTLTPDEAELLAAIVSDRLGRVGAWVDEDRETRLVRRLRGAS